MRKSIIYKFFIFKNDPLEFFTIVLKFCVNCDIALSNAFVYKVNCHFTFPGSFIAIPTNKGKTLLCWVSRHSDAFSFFYFYRFINSIIHHKSHLVCRCVSGRCICLIAACNKCHHKDNQNDCKCDLFLFHCFVSYDVTDVCFSPFGIK